MAADATYPPNRVRVSQLGNLHLNNANLYDSGETPIGQSLSITAAAGAANNSNVTFQLVDGAGLAVPIVSELTVYLSDAATGIGLTGNAASGTTAVAGATLGTDLGDLTAKKVKVVLTNAAGAYVLQIGDTGKNHYFPCGIVPISGKVVVGAQLTNASYG